MSHTTASESPSSDVVSRSSDRKAVFFCPRCTHRSPASGDWILLVREDALDVHCPDCWARLTTRIR